MLKGLLVNPIARLWLVRSLCISAILGTLACALIPSSMSGEPNPLAGHNAVYSCPTRSPVPTATVPATVCTNPPTPENALTPPAGVICTDPIVPATPLPTVTPYGRWASPGDRGSENLFRRGQNIYIGPLRLTLETYRQVPIPNSTHVAHTWTLDVANISRTDTFSITWSLQTILRAINTTDGSDGIGNWQITSVSAHAVQPVVKFGIDPDVYRPGVERHIVLPFEGPPGTAHALGFIPDLTAEGAAAQHPGTATPSTADDARTGTGGTDIYWLSPLTDVYCADDNTSGPPRQGDGGAVYPHPQATPPPAVYGYFSGWPTIAGARLTQAYGCTSYSGERRSHDCYLLDPSTAYFHTGIDLAAPEGTDLYSVAHMIVTYVGISYGVRCTFAGAEYPFTNLGWVIQGEVVDSTGHRGPYTLKWGHTMVGQELVHVGQEVFSHQKIGRMGSTGCSTGSHVHFMAQEPDGTFVNPMQLLVADRTDREHP